MWFLCCFWFVSCWGWGLPTPCRPCPSKHRRYTETKRCLARGDFGTYSVLWGCPLRLSSEVIVKFGCHSLCLYCLLSRSVICCVVYGLVLPTVFIACCIRYVNDTGTWSLSLSLSLSIYIYIYVHKHIRIHIHVHVHIHIHNHTTIYIYICIYIYIYIYTHIYIYVCVYIYIYIYIYTHT